MRFNAPVVNKDQFDAFNQAVVENGLSIFDINEIVERTQLDDADVRYIASNQRMLQQQFYPNLIVE